MIFNLVFASNTILSCSFFFFLIIELYFFLITPVIARIFIPTAELAITTGIPIKEAKTDPLTVEAK